MLIWIDAKFFCGGVECDDETKIITKYPPILRKFAGQHAKNLLKWLKRNNNLNGYHVFREEDD